MVIAESRLETGSKLNRGLFASYKILLSLTYWALSRDMPEHFSIDKNVSQEQYCFIEQTNATAPTSER
ncbi:hypothetical protein BBD42_30260 [Paenibacillus sp. BIHB 4019]|uniref:Uncharacterized protein n=1 Tax=Paenibacillus sp. BIHB 4019 TaxID=1870819 RepID=A0A1B2DRG4_9BACL|nr:hypothetical protein BBD42_30260 [Paenibacillus sp. BIHB 4019]